MVILAIETVHGEVELLEVRDGSANEDEGQNWLAWRPKWPE